MEIWTLVIIINQAVQWMFILFLLHTTMTRKKRKKGKNHG
jgi:hypothetical protein